jgi:DNA-binding LacI/PurR family transcriptional regulator
MARSESSSKKATRRPASGPIMSIPDFAKYLGLSSWTVSRAINGHPEVSEKTRRRIMAAMEEVGFRPNPLARGLGGRRTSMIGVCFMGLGNPILDRKVYHLQEFLRQHQLRSLLEMRMRDVQQEIRAIEDFRRIHVDGIVLIHSELDAAASRRVLEGAACVHVDPHLPQSTASVSVDRRRAMRLLLEHLLRLGHRTFALLGITEADPWRWSAVVETVQAHGLDPARALRGVEQPSEVESPIEAGELMAEKVLAWPKRPTALIALDDRRALGAIQALKNANIEVPRQMSVTGFDNLDFARKLHPTLTSIEQNPLRLMERAGAMLLEQLELTAEERGRGVSETVTPDLVIGESTGPAWRG